MKNTTPTTRLAQKLADLQADHDRLEAHLESLAAKFYHAQAAYEQAVQQRDQLASAARIKQRVITVLLRQFPGPVSVSLQRLIDLPYKQAA